MLTWISRCADLQFLKFLAVGVINTLFGMSVYSLCLYLGLHYVPSLLVATVLGVIFNFFSTGRLVFNNTQSGRLLKFILTYALIFALNVIIVSALMSSGFNANSAGYLSMIVLALLSFAINKYWVFS